MQSITSLRNPAVLAARALQTKGGREDAGVFLCDGEHMVAEALRNAPQRVRTLFVETDSAQRYARLIQAAGNAEVYAVPAHVLAAIAQVKTPQGIAATVETPPRARLDRMGGRVVILENVQDPGNVGTILRTADAAGFDGCVFTPGCADPYASKALRATMGSVFRVPMADAISGAEAARAFRAMGYAVIATVLDGDDFFSRAPLPQRVCLMVGNEGAGVTPEAEALATHRYRLPMRGGAESLNAAVAAAIFMYEIVNRP